MYQAILLSTEDVTSLRAAIAAPQLAFLRHSVPGLAHAVAHPLPDFSTYGSLVQDAVREVRANTNYPEDWDDLSEAANAVRQARRKFIEAVKVGDCPASVPMQFYILVEERIGSNDGPSFRPHVYVDYAEACKVLKAHAEKECSPELDEGMQLEEYSSPERGVYRLNLLGSGRSVSMQYYLQSFTFPQATAAEGSRT